MITRSHVSAATTHLCCSMKAARGNVKIDADDCAPITLYLQNR